MDQQASPRRVRRVRARRKDSPARTLSRKQPSRRPQECEGQVKARYVQAAGGALPLPVHSPRGWLAPSGSAPYKVSAALSEAQASVRQVLDAAVHSGLQLLRFQLLTKCSELHAEGVPCWKTWVTHSCGVRWESLGSEHRHEH